MIGRSGYGFIMAQLFDVLLLICLPLELIEIRLKLDLKIKLLYLAQGFLLEEIWISDFAVFAVFLVLAREASIL
jgi:hypothetical protein